MPRGILFSKFVRSKVINKFEMVAVPANRHFIIRLADVGPTEPKFCNIRLAGVGHFSGLVSSLINTLDFY